MIIRTYNEISMKQHRTGLQYSVNFLIQYRATSTLIKH